MGLFIPPQALLGLPNTWTQAQTFANVVIGSANTLAWSTDLFLQRGAANQLDLRNGTTAQTFKVFQTYTDGSNYKAVALTASGGNCLFQIDSVGSGGALDLFMNFSNLRFATGGTDRWKIDSSGILFPNADASVDVGDATHRPRNVYANTSFILTDGVTAPTATSGLAKIFVDTADGDLKIIYGDGTTKTIVVDT